jgi:hypothetical protein
LSRRPSNPRASAGTAAFPANEPRSEVRRLTPREAASIGRLEPSSAHFGRIPTIVVSIDRLREARLDHRFGFLLSLLDGSTTVGEILDLSGMPADETLSLLEQLRQRRIIAV